MDKYYNLSISIYFIFIFTTKKRFKLLKYFAFPYLPKTRSLIFLIDIIQYVFWYEAEASGYLTYKMML